MQLVSPPPTPLPAADAPPAAPLTRAAVATRELVRITQPGPGGAPGRAWEFSSIPLMTHWNMRDGARSMARADVPERKVVYVRGTLDYAVLVARGRVAISVSPMAGLPAGHHAQAVVAAGDGAWWITALGVSTPDHSRYMMAWADPFPGSDTPPRVEALAPGVAAVVGRDGVVRFG